MIDSNQIDILIEKIKSAENIGIFMHNNPDGDAAGSACGLLEILRDNFGKSATMIYSEKIPAHIKFIPNINMAVRIDDFKSGIPFDLAIAVDVSTPDLMRDGVSELFFASGYTVKIDHHDTSRDFADLNITEFLPSAAEIIYKIAIMKKLKLSKNAVIALFTGLYTDTGLFKYINDSETLRIAADLVDMGANPKRIAEQLDVKSKDITMINARTVADAEFLFNDTLALSTISKDEYDKLDGNGMDALCALRSIDGVKCVARLTQATDDEIRVSFRSSDTPINEIAIALGGGGHKFAAAAKLNGTMADARELVIAAFKKIINP